MIFQSSLNMLLIAILLILVGCFVLAKHKDFFEKVKIPFTIVALIFGITIYGMGYLPQDIIDGKGSQSLISLAAVALRALFSTCRMFILENDFSEVNEFFKDQTFYILAFNIAHIMALMLTVFTILSLFGMRFISRIQLLLAGGEKVYVFMGFNAAAKNLIQSIHKNNHDIQPLMILVHNVSDKEPDSNILKTIRENGLIHVDKKHTEVTSLKKIGLGRRLIKKEIHVFLLSNDDNLNLKTALGIIGNSTKDGVNHAQLTLYIQSGAEGIEAILENANREQNLSVEFKISNIPDISARQLMERCPLHEVLDRDLEAASVKTDLHLLIAGFDNIGAEVLRKSVYCGQFIGSGFKAVITGEAISDKRGTFFNRFPGIEDNYAIEWCEANPGSHAFYETVKKHIDTLNYLVIALGDDKANLDTAIEIERLLRREGINRKLIIAVHMVSHDAFAHYEHAPHLPHVRFFGKYAEIFTESIIINESMDRMARKMNELYNKLYQVDPADNWNKLDTFTKESNRSASMNIRTKLYLMGTEIVEKRGLDPEPVDFNDYFIGPRMDNLAMQEHLRWNAFHFASGWTTWALKDIGNAVKAKDSARRRHACLVSWEGLKAVTDRFNASPTYEELDYEQVKNIPAILDFAGLTAIASKTGD